MPDTTANLTGLPDLLILRHGETEWNRAGRLQGALDSELTSLGQAQAAQQGDILRSLGAGGWPCFCSPQGRAFRTAVIARGGSEHGIETDPRLREIGLGDWTGRIRAEVANEFPALFAESPLGWYDHVPGGEGLAALAARLAEFASGLTGPAVIVTHGITSRMLRCLAQGLPTSAFGEVGGGQGVVYRVSGGVSTCLDTPAPGPISTQ